MLLIGSQFVIWSVTGAYMVFFDIDYIHGDSLVINHQKKIKAEHLTYASQTLFQQYPKAKNLSVGMLVNREVYRFNLADKQMIVDASNGKLLSPLAQEQALAVAKYYYSGDGNVIDSELIITNPPFELSTRHLPAWRVNFDNFGSPALYISASSGEVVTKRHEFWRLFDWMFRFHIMDYGDDADASNWLLFIVALFAVFAAFSGLVLTYFKVIKPITKQKFKPREKSSDADNTTKLSQQNKTLSSGEPS